ncbi:ankyrin repeat domain protein, putative [Entamoeba invadens IP1]|uniref:Ankyrin repeat domain protein, putative n=1 Tax=Entamoeba invadens IP1 TaxID=370355 RepID=A0A0A1U4U6_ENTIV|nr:ankyrin repeat domain protein, putative [Entamoeba invadens IP1]ELP86756.1 ankyrin repeat domain protein, putative [Entamoeba invadens IP1]|eukprot:XP_004186102.1 ankyrin repeat domain protein, putative [Entamoeba invadens IP1]
MQQLVHAIEKSDGSQIRALLQKNHTLLQDPDLLHNLLTFHNYELVEILHAVLSTGCPCVSQNDNGETPLHIASGQNNLVIVELLIDSSQKDPHFDINATDNHGQTSLHRAAKTTCSDPSIVKCLIDHGASIVSIDHTGKTAFDYAEENKHYAKAQLLNIDEEIESKEQHYYNAYGYEIPYPETSPRKERHSDNVKWLVTVGHWKVATLKEQKWVKKHITMLNPQVRPKIWECFTGVIPSSANREEMMKLYAVGCQGKGIKEVRKGLNVFPDHKAFIEMKGKYRLERMVVAFLEVQKKSVISSVCKIAGMLLCVVGEDSGFDILMQLKSEKYAISEFIDSNAPEAIYIFPRMFKLEVCQLYDKLCSIGFEMNYFVTWFADLFIDVFPPLLTIRVWDCYLYEGKDVLYLIAINYLKLLKPDLMKANTAEEAYGIIDSISAKLLDSAIANLTKDKIDKTMLETLRNGMKKKEQN